MIRSSLTTGVILLALLLISVSGCIASETDPSLTITGEIIYNDLEGGFFGITTQEGDNYLPLDLPDEFKKEGLQVTVTGIIDPDVMTIQMWGQPLRIQSIDITEGPSEIIKGWYEGKNPDFNPDRDLAMTRLLLESSMALEQKLEAMNEGVKKTAAELKGINLKDSNLTPYLVNLTEMYPEIYEVTILDRAGIITDAYPELYNSSIGADTSEQELMSELIKNPVPGMSRYIETLEGEKAVNIVYPLFSSSNSLTGYLSILFHPEELVKNSVEVPFNEYQLNIQVIQPDGTYLSYEGEYDTNFSVPIDSPPARILSGCGLINYTSDMKNYHDTSDPVTVSKMTYWTTISLHNIPWRILVISG